MLEEEEYNLYVEANTMLVNPRERYCKQLGFDEGKQQGISEGEVNGKLEVARRMLDDGFSIGKVVELTGLSMEDILNVE